MREERPHVVVLSGPPGAGKTTVAKLLVNAWPGQLAMIEGDVFWRFFVKPNPDPRANFTTLMRAAMAAAVQFQRTGNDVLVDFSIPPGFIAAARKFVRDAPLDYVVLRPSLDVCAARSAARDNGKKRDYTPLRRLYDLFDGAPQHTISDDKLSAADTARAVMEGLAAGRFRAA